MSQIYFKCFMLTHLILNSLVRVIQLRHVRLLLPTFHTQEDQGRAWMPTLAVRLQTPEGSIPPHPMPAFALYTQVGTLLQGAVSLDIYLWCSCYLTHFTHKNKNINNLSCLQPSRPSRGSAKVLVGVSGVAWGYSFSGCRAQRRSKLQDLVSIQVTASAPACW